MSAQSDYWDAVEARQSARAPKVRPRRPQARRVPASTGEADLTPAQVVRGVRTIIEAVEGEAARRRQALERWPCRCCGRERCMVWEARCLWCQV